MKSVEEKRPATQSVDDGKGLTEIRPTDLPSPPQVAVKIMQASAGGMADGKELANLSSPPNYCVS